MENLDFNQIKTGFQDYLKKHGENYGKDNQKVDSENSSVFMNSKIINVCIYLLTFYFLRDII